jgi:abequosyltransferase
MENNLILSICIPTYNRSKHLEATVLSIVCQDRFLKSNDIEIIISDNCSEDDTGEVSRTLIKNYGDRIKYYRNDKNIKDMNFEKVLSYGKGMFLKLNNDTLSHLEGSLEKIIQTINENRSTKNLLFFSNGELGAEKNIFCKDLDSFVGNVSYFSGWIGGYGIWREDYLTFNDYNRRAHLQLTQVDVLFRLINSQRTVFVNNEKLFNVQQLSKKGDYDLLKVFLDNYLFLLSEQLSAGTLLKRTMVSEKKKLLLQFIFPWLVNIKTNPEVYQFKCKNWFQRVFKYYKKDGLTLLRFLIKFEFTILKNILKKHLVIWFW